MVFCNIGGKMFINVDNEVTILILIDGFLQLGFKEVMDKEDKVTILILIDGFLQYIRKNL